MPVKNFVKLLKTTVIGIEVNMELTIENNIIQPQNGINIEDISDGYHSYKELYQHRELLFSIICRLFPEKSWKSKAHADGSMDSGWIIVGITTNEGDFTYHYKLEDWNMFPVKELEKAPEYDGHTPKDIVRLLSLLK